MARKSKVDLSKFPSRQTISRRAYEKADEILADKKDFVAKVMTEIGTLSVDFGQRFYFF